MGASMGDPVLTKWRPAQRSANATNATQRGTISVPGFLEEAVYVDHQTSHLTLSEDQTTMAGWWLLTMEIDNEPRK